MRTTFECRQCWKPFQSPAKYGRKIMKFCSPSCYHASQRLTSPLKCEECGVEFLVKNNIRSKRKYCAMSCVRAANVKLFTNKKCLTCCEGIKSSKARPKVFCNKVCQNLYRPIAPLEQACLKCGITKAIRLFGKKDTRTGYSSWCSECRKTYDRARCLTKRAKIHGVPLDVVFKKLRGGCEICGDPTPSIPTYKTPSLAFDHNHRTGLFRGFLCRPCNAAIGLLKDSPKLLRKAALYLERAERGRSRCK
jgi:hypothetical protein